MPKYNFTCNQCGNTLHKYVSTKVETLSCECGGTLERAMPKINSPTQVKEVVDPYLNKRLNKDHDSLVEERNQRHYWEVEVPRLVQQYSLETCLEQGWLKYNDKGELVINKPPSKR